MHELSIAVALVDEVSKILIDRRLSRATSVTLSIGALSGVDRQALETAFPVAAEKSPLSEAELRIEEVPVKIHCRGCGRESFPDIPVLICVQCQSADIEMLEGRDMLIKKIEAI